MSLDRAQKCILGFSFVCASLIGCATPQLKTLRTANLNLPRAAHVVGVPQIAQTKNYCGPATLAMVLQWTGDTTATPEILGPSVYTEGLSGSLQTDMLSAARRKQKLAIELNDLSSVLAEVAAQRPVIVLRNLAFAWYPMWHYSVVVGYDLDTEQLFLHSGKAEATSVTMKVFERTWARSDHWALLVLKPDQLPVSVGEPQVTKATAALEDVAGFAVTKITYTNILKRWPQSLEARIGLANALFNEGATKNAISELTKAVAINPTAAPAWHNLALAYHKNKQSQNASHAARQALKSVGPGQRSDYEAAFKQVGIAF